MSNTESLAAFGFGTLFENWELNLRPALLLDSLPASFKPSPSTDKERGNSQSQTQPEPGTGSPPQISNPTHSPTTNAPSPVISHQSKPSSSSPALVSSALNQSSQAGLKPVALQNGATVTFELPPLMLMSGFLKKTMRITTVIECFVQLQVSFY